MGLSGPVPRRVEAATKAGMLELIDAATASGWEHRRACAYLQLGEARAWRWRERREAGCLQDRAAGGHAVHGLLDAEQEEIVALFDEWGEIDRSHRKLAHRGSYTGRVWVSPSTVMRVLAAHGLILRAPRRAGRSERRPFPEWASYTRNSIWIYDATHFAGCPGVAVVTVMDLVTRKWICEVISGEETGTQIQVAFIDALELEGLLELVEARLDGVADPAPVDAPSLPPILLAVSDNGPQMTSGRTWTTSATPANCAQSSPASASSTTPSGCTPASATSPPTTNTKAAAPRSERPATRACIAPAAPGSRTIEPNAINANRPRSRMRSNRIPDPSR